MAEVREDLKHEGPRMAKLLTDKTALTYYLLGHTHAALARLLEVRDRSGCFDARHGRPRLAAVRLGAMFHLAFGGGLLQRPAQGDAPRSAR